MISINLDFCWLQNFEGLIEGGGTHAKLTFIYIYIYIF